MRCLFVQIAGLQLLQQLVAVKTADEAAGVVVVGDIRRVLGEDVADELVDGIVSLFLQLVIDAHQDIVRVHGYGIVELEAHRIVKLIHLSIPPHHVDFYYTRWSARIQTICADLSKSASQSIIFADARAAGRKASPAATAPQGAHKTSPAARLPIRPQSVKE